MKRFLSFLCVLTLLLGLVPLSAGAAESFSAGGWFEALYAELPGVKDNDVSAVSYSGAMTGELTGDDFTYLVRETTLSGGASGVRVDIPGLKEGTYTLTVTVQGVEHTFRDVKVTAHDRSGYAHFNYDEGVGAYKDDGTLKANAKVLYVTDANRNTVSVTSKDGTKVTGIGNILNTSGKSDNGNKDILKKLAQDGTPLVVRLVGNVTAPEGATAPGSTAYGGNEDDNGYMCRMQNAHNLTIEGVGADAVVNGWGFHFIRSSSESKTGFGRSFELRNVTFRNVPEDCVGMEANDAKVPVERCWIHNCAFYGPTNIKDYSKDQDKGQGDGACDFKKGQYMTMSYNYFEGYHKTNLVGGSNSQEQYHITWHHVYWKKCESRGPLGRQADMHIYNCLYEGQTSYCMDSRANCTIFSEYNTFHDSKSPMTVKLGEQKDGATWYGGPIKSYNDAFTGTTKIPTGEGIYRVTDKTQKMSAGNATVKYLNFDTDPTVSYIPSGDYLLDEDVEVAQAKVKAYAGPMKAAAEVVAPEPSHQHNWKDSKVIQAADCVNPGTVEQTCDVPDCPMNGKQTVTIPALGHDYSGPDGACVRCGATSQTYELTGNAVYAALEAQSVAGITKNPADADSNPSSYVVGKDVSVKFDDFFTLNYAINSRIDPSPKSFAEPDAFQGTHRINFQGAATATKNSIQFTTQKAATVKVWWVGAVKTTETNKDPRPMVILDAKGQVAAGPSETSRDGDLPRVTTFALPQGGTYYLGAQGGKNFIYKVEVTVGRDGPAPLHEGVLDGAERDLGWELSKEGVLSVTGDLPAGDTVLVACYDEQGLFTGAELLTREDLELTLGTQVPKVRLFWLNGAQAPKCDDVVAWGGTE